MNKFCSIFSQLLQLFPRYEFQKLVKETHAERHARGFTCWGQFVSMLFCQLGRAHSLREITGGLRCCEGKLKHLGITAPHRSTLPMPMNTVPGSFIKNSFSCSLNEIQNEGIGKKKFRFKNKLVSLDSTIIDLSISLFDWAHFRRTKGATNCICSWTMMAIFPPLPASPKEKSRISRSPVSSSFLPEPSWSMTGAILTTASLADGPPRRSILSPD